VYDLLAEHANGNIRGNGVGWVGSVESLGGRER